MKPPQDIAHFWRQAGIHPDRKTAFYCGTGWRASMAFFYAWLMGWENISVYDGGWYEWSMLSHLPGGREPKRAQDGCCVRYRTEQPVNTQDNDGTAGQARSEAMSCRR
jgi:hypothetical protein